MSDKLKAPFPWFGGKSRAASLIWPRFGDVANYVEPFFGSGAVLLSRPHAPRIETVNDVDCFVANFWRSIAADPEQVAHFADGPVNECDLHARHKWLVNRGEFRERMRSDPEYSDAKVAGWWVWGLCAWIGSGWCSADPGGETGERLPMLGGSGDGDCGGAHPGRGIFSKAMSATSEKLPLLGGTKGTGVHRRGALPGEPSEQMPRFGGNSTTDGSGGLTGIHGVTVRSRILETFEALSRRLRGVRVACGDFERILSDSVTWRHGTTAILLDSPYANGEEVYSAGEDPKGVFARTAKWAEEHGSDKRLRICLCYYDGTWTPPAGWEVVPWKAKGGYGSQSKSRNDNARRERLAFSPGCLRSDAIENSGPLFAERPR